MEKKSIREPLLWMITGFMYIVLLIITEYSTMGLIYSLLALICLIISIHKA